MRKPSQEEREELLGQSKYLFSHEHLRTVIIKPITTPLQYRVEHQLQHRTYAHLLTEEADQPCSDLSVEPMLNKLNELLETSHTCSVSGVFQLFDDCI